MNYKEFFGTVEKKKVLFDIKDQDIAKYIHVSLRTYARRKANPKTLNTEEASMIAKFLKFSEKEKFDAFC